ncbi:GDYXXLXY domain-containing protein [Paenibacillus solisilvae]|uniref:GDYXXLXY domain-containing protein n=1 Tax=Paenibacillus solisilvae TaxID=2486751 RepID=A0ABW0WA56_9BACL
MTNRVWPRNRSKWLIVLLVVQVLFLAAIAGIHYSTLWFGKEIRLQTVPVDPRDLLYGDYVQLNYDINRVPLSLRQETGDKPKSGDRIYVVLQENQSDGIYRAKAVASRKPSLSVGQIMLKGRVEYADDDAIRISYGIERYYVKENTGKELEKQAGNLVVKVKTSAWGSPVIEDITAGSKSEQ